MLTVERNATLGGTAPGRAATTTLSTSPSSESAAIDILTLDCSELWHRVLAECPDHDFHHLPEYHAHAEAHGEGRAHLVVYRGADCTIAVPLLVRRLADLPEFGEVAHDLCDATSVYGYAGPIASRRDIPDEVLRDFSRQVEAALRDLRVVSVFSRLHPLLEQRHLLAHLGECVPTGRTVSLDLTRPVGEQYAGFRKSHRRGLKKLREFGLEVVEDTGLEHLDAFVDIYTASMRRVGAARQYFFDREYFASLIEKLGPAIRHFFVRQGSTIVAATLHSTYRGIVQAHLGGTADHALGLAPDKLLIDEVRLWAVERGYRVFHHGGGVGAKEDSLYQFKAGFSDCAHDFFTWRWVVDPAASETLCRHRAAWNRAGGLAPMATDFFPPYRTPAGPAEPAAPPPVELPPGVLPDRGSQAFLFMGEIFSQGLFA